MKINELADLLKDKRVAEEIHKHLWIESQKEGYSIGIERATDEWLNHHGLNWMRYHLPDSYAEFMHKRGGNNKAKKKVARAKTSKTTVVNVRKSKSK